tara:strand:- start:187 stop:762 length:576 start_codon:yes stop_codon:yes gene_type:complete
MNYIYGLVLFIVIASALIFIQSINNELTYYVSTVDNKKYLVRNDDRKHESANYMARVQKKIYILLEHMKSNYGDDGRVQRLLQKYNSDNICESMKNSIYTSYSVNKGEKIVICIKEKDKEETFIDMNTTVFVVIHEIAHIMTKSVGHNKDFWDNMKFLLENSIKLGIYTKEDYKNAPKKYCGIMITDSPLD